MAHAATTEPDNTPQPKKRNWKLLIALPAWVAASFAAAQLLLQAMVWVCQVVHIPILELASPAITETVLASLVYILTLAIAIGVPYAVRRRPTGLETLGLTRLPSWTDIGLTPLGFIVYALASGGLIYLVTQFAPWLATSQAQDVGFRSLNHQYEYTLAFVTLVVLAPMAEETLFRGYLYGKLQAHVPVIVAALATSLLFGAAHLPGGDHIQWSVALDTFVLSLVMCSLRSLTGSIWAGILLHMAKNAVAFYLVFVIQSL